MEHESELGKDDHHTDDGYSEKKLAKQTDLLVSKKNTPVQSGSVFTSKKNSQTVFQAQKDEEK